MPEAGVVGYSYRKTEDKSPSHSVEAIGNDAADFSSKQVMVPKADDENKDGEQETTKDTTDKEKVAFSEIFRYASARDYALMLVGTLSAVIHGAIYVLIVIIIGKQIDVFVDVQRSNNYLDALNLREFNLTNEDIWNNRSLLKPILEYRNITENLTLPNVTREGIVQEMKDYTYWYILAGCGTLLFAFLQITCFVLSAERQIRIIRTKFLRAILRQNIGWYDKLGSGQLNTRLSDDMYKILDGMSDKMACFIQFVACFFTGFAQGFGFGPKLAAVMLAICPALIGAALIASKVNASLTQKELKAYSKAGKIAEEVLSNIRTVCAFGGESKEIDRYNTNLTDAYRRGIRKGVILGAGMGVAWLIVYLSYGLGFWYGAKLVRDDGYSAGSLLIVFFSIVTGAIAIGQAGPNLQAIASARGAAYTIFKIIDREPEIDSSSEDGEKPQEVVGNISFDNVHFSYPTRPDVKVLNGLNLDIKVGQTVALVGSSGCGKSTTVQLLQRFYDPLSGSVMVDGIDVRRWNLRYLRDHVGIVSQEPVLFGTSISENIRYGRDGVTQADIEAAAKNANAHDFISKLPEKYETLVGQRGSQLSGGQKQRIAIARALVRNPKILLLDEATSALDTESESIVQEALDKASEGRTTIVIAHRLSTIRNADVICGFQKGVIVEKGSHDDLMREGEGIYHDLAVLQTRQAEVDSAIIEEKDTVEDADKKTLDEDTASPMLNTASQADKGVAARGEDIDQDLGIISNFRKSLRGSLRGIRMRMPSTAMAPAMIGRVSSYTGEHGVDDVDAATTEDVPLTSRPVRRILRHNAPEWPYIVAGCIACLVNGAEPPLFGVVFTSVINVFTYIDMDKQQRDAAYFSLIFVIFGVVMLISYFVQYYMFAKSGEGLTMRLRRMTFKAMLRQNIAWFDDHNNSVGALTTRLATNCSSVQGATGSRLGLIMQNLANVGVGLVLAFLINYRLTFVMCAFLPLIALAGFVETLIMNGVASKDKTALERAGKVAMEAIDNIRTVASLNKEDQFYQMYYDRLEEPYQNAKRKAYVFGASYAVSQAVIYFCFGVAFLYGSYLIQIDSTVQFADVFLVVTVIMFGALGIGQTIAFAPDFSKATMAAQKIFQLFDRQPPIDVLENGGEKPTNFDGTVEFRSVRFRYPNRPEVTILQGLSVGVRPGETLALVGSSGCGKSTTVQLIERFYDALSGQLFLDGQDIKSLNIQYLRTQIGIVSQEPILFDKTIAENIAYGDNSRDVPIDEVMEAARNSNIHNFISSLPLGYDTRVGDKGTQLSGGQKQRIAIARALLRRPKILLLDEATSALDTESEKIVQEALDRARQGRTCIVIAHRLSTIQDADQIAVIHHGRVAELGTHHQLLKCEGIYYGLQMAQTKRK